MSDCNIIVRAARASDLAIVNKLLYQVEDIHRVGRPDLFKPGEKKYTDVQLLEIFQNPKTPVFVAEEDGEVLGYVFCILQETVGSKCIFDHTTLYIDAFAWTNPQGEREWGSYYTTMPLVLPRA